MSRPHQQIMASYDARGIHGLEHSSEAAVVLEVLRARSGYLDPKAPDHAQLIKDTKELYEVIVEPEQEEPFAWQHKANLTHAAAQNNGRGLVE